MTFFQESSRSETETCYLLVFVLGTRLISLGPGFRVAERTADEGLLHHSSSASASRLAVQPRWKTASCVAESKVVPLGS